MIQFKCPECGRSIETGDERSRKRIQCPQCLEVVLVPKATKQTTSAGPVSVEESGLVPWLNVGMRATCMPWSLDCESENAS